MHFKEIHHPHFFLLFFSQTMKNVSCRKLVIDGSKAPQKVGTLKDISLYGNYSFPTSGPKEGGLIARPLAGIGKKLGGKTKLSYKVLLVERYL